MSVVASIYMQYKKKTKGSKKQGMEENKDSQVFQYWSDYSVWIGFHLLLF